MRVLRRFKASAGQGLLEVVVVVAVFGGAVAVAMPAYLGFQDRKADKKARANLSLAVQMAEAYRTDHGSYIGMDTVDLRKIDPRLSATLTIAFARRGTYCLTDNVHGQKWSIRGPYRGDAKFTASGDCT